MIRELIDQALDRLTPPRPPIRPVVTPELEDPDPWPKRLERAIAQVPRPTRDETP